MKHFRGLAVLAVAVALAASTFLPLHAFAQSPSKSEPWIHVRVESKDDRETVRVRVNVPVEMAAKVLPAIKHAPLHDGKVRLDCGHMDDIDLRTMLDAVRSSKDGQYVTVQGHEDDVRIAKNAGYLYIHVTEKNRGSQTANDSAGQEVHVRAKASKVEVKVPMKVVDALLSAGNDELDIVAALRALSSYGDTLVSVKDDDNTVRVWIDSKNISD
jgi:WD40 repeat protein